MAISKVAQAIEDEFAAYQERKNFRQAPAWMPEPGTTIKAEVIGLKMGSGDYGPYPIVVYKVLVSPDGRSALESTVSVHAFHTLLREKLAELHTEIGSVQWITYDGKVETNASKKARAADPNAEKKEYHLYDVENDGQVEDVTGKDVDFKF